MHSLAVCRQFCLGRWVDSKSLVSLLLEKEAAVTWIVLFCASLDHLSSLKAQELCRGKNCTPETFPVTCRVSGFLSPAIRTPDRDIRVSSSNEKPCEMLHTTQSSAVLCRHMTGVLRAIKSPQTKNPFASPCGLDQNQIIVGLLVPPMIGIIDNYGRKTALTWIVHDSLSSWELRS